MLFPEIRIKIFNVEEKNHLTEVPFIEVDTEDNGLTR
jgi:hypothetical protein